MPTYVNISREEFEEWLDSLNSEWQRDKTKAGIYFIRLSDNVHIHVSSSIGSNSSAVSVGNAAIDMWMESSVTFKTLNKKDLRQSRFNRTTGWRKSLTLGFHRLKDAYLKHKRFYEVIAVETLDQYKERWKKLITDVDGWKANQSLTFFYNQLDRSILTEQNEKELKKLIENPSSQETDSKPNKETQAWLDKQKEIDARNLATKKQEIAEEAKISEKFLAQLRKLWSAAKQAEDQWTQDFVKSLAEQVKAKGVLGKIPTRNQLKPILDKLRFYRIDQGGENTAQFIHQTKMNRPNY